MNAAQIWDQHFNNTAEASTPRTRTIADDVTRHCLYSYSSVDWPLDGVDNTAKTPTKDRQRDASVRGQTEPCPGTHTSTSQRKKHQNNNFHFIGRDCFLLKAATEVILAFKILTSGRNSGEVAAMLTYLMAGVGVEQSCNFCLVAVYWNTNVFIGLNRLF